jgi:osmotically-inducible protein OsmY
VAFEFPEADVNALSALLSRRLAKTPAIRAQTPIRVEVQGRTALLQGVVATEHDRVIAEQMVRLEAGIEAVKNEIVVGKPKPPPSIPAPGT